MTEDKLREAVSDQTGGFFYACTGVSIAAVIILLAAHALNISLEGIPEFLWTALIYVNLTLFLGLFAAVVFGNVKRSAAEGTDSWIKFFAGLAAAGLFCLAVAALEPFVWEVHFGKWKRYLLYSLCTVFCIEFWVLTRACRGYAYDMEWNDRALSKDECYIPKLLDRFYKEMNEDTVVCERICHELYTYAGRARFYKRSYYVASAVTIAFPAVVVVLNNLEGDQKLVTSVLSAAVTIVAGMMGTIKLRESWIRNRVSCEHVKSVLFQYITKTGTYSNDKDPIRKGASDDEKQKIRTSLLIENLENIFQTEYGEWKRLREQQKE